MNKILGIIMFLNLSCSFSQNQFDSILSDLSKSYIKDNDIKDCVIKTEDYSTLKVEEDTRLYNNAVNAFRNSEIEIIEYLLKFENDYTPSTWIETPNPCSSSYTRSRNKAQDVLVLIDNYLRGCRTLSKDSTSLKLNYDFIKSFYKENKGLNKKEFQKKYIKQMG
ncbi:hypothetical protein EQG68_00990 [Flavobacterium piscinae]|jgi:hypothetical protein|uniref:Uncharacterized protein n=1 Tax=Flavobacterium piscinae TaxID=2506424 RepID=A0A4Q1KYN1_9FLAO|nr:hypothetical protein [Flavobacterium piscinae]RXR35503.1 hypothetical protein EQG68_00990 [Flavobacterium piscinae]